MFKRTLAFARVGLGVWLALAAGVQARVVTVTTADNLNPPAGQKSLLQALTELQDGDEIRFNLPGPGPHLIETPPDGYPLITRHHVVIDGYSQPGAAPNTNPILAPNNARLRIVLDSRNGNHRLMNFPGDGPNDDTGFGDREAAILGVLGARGFVLRGVALLGVPRVGPDAGVALYGVAFAKGASGRISGCWIGLHPDGATLAGPADGVAGFRYRVRDESGADVESLLINDVVLGVPRDATNAPADFNVLVGIPGIPVILEGHGARIAGNFFGVMPDGLRDVNLMLDPALAGSFEGFIEIGRGGNNTVIGTDGDGVNDAHERNIFGGTLPPAFGGYDHSLEFYGQAPGTNIVIAGNFFGVGIDGRTRFTNAVPVLNAAGGTAQFRFGSNFDGVSDDLEGNVVFNFWPPDLFGPEYLVNLNPTDLGFFDELAAGGILAARGNTFVNNLAFPASPLRDAGTFWTGYYQKALEDPDAGLVPVIAPDSTARRLRGTVPLARTAEWPETHVDLYLADPEGLAAGRALELPELPDGFVQGRQFLGTFRDNGPADADPERGRFDFDIAGLGLVEGLVTITANYATGPVTAPGTVVLTGPFSAPVRLTGGGAGELRFTSIRLEAGGVRLEWTGGGTLQAAAQPVGPWTDVPGAASGYTTPATGGARFFRLRR
jgi:hypothetical protein